MKYLDVRIDLGAETGQDARASVQAAQGRLAALQERIREHPAAAEGEELAALRIEQSSLLIELKRMAEAWDSAKSAFELSVHYKQWQSAARSCELLYLAEQDLSLQALGHGIWLAVTFPVDPELTVSLLNHVIEATPDHSDGAAVAAAAAVYVVDLRAQGHQYDELGVHSRQMLTTVARRHSGVQNQADLDRWVERLQLNEPEQFLARLRDVIDVLVQGEWWLDLESIQSEIPDQ